jgi:hypothetical protein
MNLEADGAVPGHPMKIHAEAAPGMGLHGGDSDGLTSLGPAQMHDMAAAGILTKVMVETDDPVHLGDR